MADFPPVHPGKVLQREFLEHLGLSQNKLALSIGVSARRINEIVLGKRAITAETALLLSKALGPSPQFWINLQTHYDLEIAEEKLNTKLDSIHRIKAHA